MGPLVDAALVGMLHGITAIFPVSSSGHMALTRLLFGLQPSEPGTLLAAYVGVFMATAWVLRVPLQEAIVGGLRALARPRRLFTTPGGQDAFVVLVATGPTAVLSLALGETASGFAYSPFAVGAGLAATAIILLSSQWFGHGKVEFPSWGAALAIGLGQGLTVLPGVSRSAVTICVALWFGIQRGRAFELSMLVSLPLLFGAIVLELPGQVGALGAPGPAAASALAAAACALPALHVLERVVRGQWLSWFALWVGPLAVATLAMAQAWPGR